MAAKKLMNAHEALEYLENINVPSEDDLSDDEHFISSSDKSSSEGTSSEKNGYFTSKIWEW